MNYLSDARFNIPWKGELLMLTLSRFSWPLLKARLRDYKDESGQGMVEYVLIIALIAVALILVFGNVADAIKLQLDKVVGALK